MRPSSTRKSSSKIKKVQPTKSTRPKQGDERSNAGTRAVPEAATSQQTLQASACSQPPPEQRKHTPSTVPQPQQASPRGRLTPDWFNDEHWATMLALESDYRPPLNFQPDRPTSTAQHPPATTVQRSPSNLRDGEPRTLKSAEADFQPPRALLVPVDGTAADKAASLRPPDAQLTADRRTEPTSAAPGKQPPVGHLGSQQAVMDAATPARQPPARADFQETTSCSRDGTDAEIARAATLAVRPSTPSGLPEVTLSGANGKSPEIVLALSSGSQPSVTASPPQTTSMRRESTDAEIDRVISPVTWPSAPTSPLESSSKSPEGAGPDVTRTATLTAPSSAPSSIPETTPRSPQGADDVEAIRVATPAAQPSAPERFPDATPRSPEGTAATPAAPASMTTSTPETTLRSPLGTDAKGVQERPEAEGDSVVSQRGSEPLMNGSRRTPSVVRILDDGVISGSHRTDSAGATTTGDTGQGSSTQCSPTPLGEHKRGRKADPGVPSQSAFPDLYGPVLDVTTDSVVSMAGGTGELSWATETKARGLLFTLLHCLSQALLNILIKQVVHIPKAKIAYYVAFGYMLGSMPEAFALKNPFGPRHVQVGGLHSRAASFN
ncbi:proteoglycan 4-like [Dermacentor silvarum]|uniref:proteoglycan 4-like n=1 Tax=Dermacentor silvarum TaxID=543639 RepID=UPI002100D0B0|nr:proteoglycan 4-like [Dermacentor silvarum]